MQNTENVLRILTFVLGGSILKMLGGQKGRLFLFLGNKKAPMAQTSYTNEMTLELSHLSPTIKQGSFLFDFSI